MNWQTNLQDAIMAVFFLVVVVATTASAKSLSDIIFQRRPSDDVAIFAVSAWLGTAAWAITRAVATRLFHVSQFDQTAHAFMSAVGFLIGVTVYILCDDALTKIASKKPAVTAQSNDTPLDTGAAPPPNTGLSTDVRSLSERTTANVTVKTTMDRAPAIRNPVSALADTLGTNAQISALENAARLAAATARTADAEAEGLQALIRRDERLIELRARQQVGGELQQNKIEEQRMLLGEDAHRRKLARERHTKEHLDAKRSTANARNGVEAVKHFKETKFKLGEKRVEARIADIGVDTATATAASRSLGVETDDKAHSSLIHLQDLAEATRQQILIAASEDRDADWLQDHLARIERMLAK